MTTMKREEILALLTEFFESRGEEVMRESGNAITFPSIDAGDNELFVKIAVSIPRGDRSGEAYDGYAAAQQFKEHNELVAAKREQRAKENAIKAAKAKEKREAAKAKKEAEAAELAKFKEERGQ
jgi:hypothetical protein